MKVMGSKRAPAMVVKRGLIVGLGSEVRPSALCDYKNCWLIYHDPAIDARQHTTTEISTKFT